MRNDSVSCIQQRKVICKYATIVYLVILKLNTTRRDYMQVSNDSVS